MTINLLGQITICMGCITIFLAVLDSYRRTQKALRWWYYRQASKLSLEAEQIRDSLLQESFTIRRHLETLTTDNLDLSINKAQDCLVKVDNLHQSLTQLSERLFPIYLQYSFPCAIQCLLESWIVTYPHLRCYTDMPSLWRHETVENSLIVFTTIDELFRISLPDVLTQISIYITLKQHCKTRRIMVKIIYPDESTFTSHSKTAEQKHLCHSFQSLTSGKCFFESKNLSYCWYLHW